MARVWSLVKHGETKCVQLELWRKKKLCAKKYWCQCSGFLLFETVLLKDKSVVKLNFRSNFCYLFDTNRALTFPKETHEGKFY